MKKIVFYGDSNTYGYDPRGFLGMRYPERIRWTYIVRNRFKGKYEIIEEGQNGRCLPCIPRDEGFLKTMTCTLSEDDAFIIMLGTNDILCSYHPDAGAAILKMDSLLKWIQMRGYRFRMFVIGPVPIEGDEEMRLYYDACIQMNAGFGSLCEKYGAQYYDAGEWGISLAYDGVHFSEEGCRQFSKHMIEVLEKDLTNDMSEYVMHGTVFDAVELTEF